MWVKIQEHREMNCVFRVSFRYKFVVFYSTVYSLFLRFADIYRPVLLAQCVNSDDGRLGLALPSYRWRLCRIVVHVAFARQSLQ